MTKLQIIGVLVAILYVILTAKIAEHVFYRRPRTAARVAGVLAGGIYVLVSHDYMLNPVLYWWALPVIYGVLVSERPDEDYYRTIIMYTLVLCITTGIGVLLN